MLTRARLQEVLDYDLASGVFIWRVQRRGHRIGAVAGTINPKGYRYICIDGVRYAAGRLAWLYMTGEWPKNLIDHKNTIRDDNRFCNLREATDSQNQANSVRNRGTSKFKGVHYYKSRKRWTASLSKNGRTIHLGYFDSPEAAHEAYARGAQKFHGEFARYD